MVLVSRGRVRAAVSGQFGEATSQAIPLWSIWLPCLSSSFFSEPLSWLLRKEGKEIAHSSQSTPVCRSLGPAPASLRIPARSTLLTADVTAEDEGSGKSQGWEAPAIVRALQMGLLTEPLGTSLGLRAGGSTGVPICLRMSVVKSARGVA